MADVLDVANESVEFHSSLIEKKRQQEKQEQQRLRAMNPEPNCIECDIDITARRKALPDAIRCVDCQTLKEHKDKQKHGHS